MNLGGKGKENKNSREANIFVMVQIKACGILVTDLYCLELQILFNVKVNLNKL